MHWGGVIRAIKTIIISSSKTNENRSVNDIYRGINSIQEALEDPPTKLQANGCDVLTANCGLDDKLQEVEDHDIRDDSHYGITCLPDELLAEIFFSAARSPGEAVTLCLVCRRFRWLVLSLPQLWNKFPLRSRMHITSLRIIAERSGFHGLRGVVENVKELDESSRFILSLHPYLRELTFERLHAAAAVEVVASLQGCTMPALSRLYCRTWQRDLSRVFESVKMPLLQELVVYFIPHPASRPTLTSCKLHLNDRFHLKSLLNFLAGADNLQHLTFDISSDMILEREDFGVVDPVTLPSLISLTIELRVAEVFRSGMDIMKNLRLPALRTLELHVVLSGPLPYDLLCEGIEPFLSVRRFYMDLYIPSWTVGFQVDLDRILAHLPKQIETISLGSGGKEAFQLHVVPTCLVFPNLQQLCLDSQGCSLSTKMLWYLRDLLRMTAPPDVQLHFIRCLNVKDGTYGLDEIATMI